MILSPMLTSTERSTLPAGHDRMDHVSNGLLELSKPLTLNFATLQSPSQTERYHPPSPSRIAPAASIRCSSSPTTNATSPVDSNTFLTSLAAQERRVLELREELHQAEADLSQLKKQWAQYEAGRKKNEMRHVERLQPLLDSHSVAAQIHSENGGPPAAALRASLENGTDRPVVRKSTQRVFSGSRHARALSLLSPGATSNQSMQSGPFERVLSPALTTTDLHSSQPPLSRSSTLSGVEHNLGFGRTYKQLAGRGSMPPPSKDAIMNSGKKMASDLREGLWTFFEDIRQATVGEEGINGIETRVAGSGRGHGPDRKRSEVSEHRRKATSVKDERRIERQNGKVLNTRNAGIKTSSIHARKENSSWNELGLEAPSKQNSNIGDTIPEVTSDPNPALVDIDDTWDIWDSAMPPQHSPRHDESWGTVSRNSSDGLPWPELTKLTPSRLSRTVSDLMKEWESPAVTSGSNPAGLEDQAVASPHI